MQYRCYTCGFVFRQGLPPLEALSDQQMSLVQGSRTNADDVRLALLGTNFQGLGAANFCDICLLAILDNPSAFAAHGEHVLEQDRNSVWCDCGVTYWTSTNDRTKRGWELGPNWVEVNRLRMRHLSDTMGA